MANKAWSGYNKTDKEQDDLQCGKGKMDSGFYGHMTVKKSKPSKKVKCIGC